jgi:hypothetical protein
LLVKDKDETIVRYSLKGYMNPIGVVEWKQQATGTLPQDLQSNLPTIEDIEREFSRDDE